MLRLDVPGGRSGYYFYNGSSWASSIIETLAIADNQRVVEVQNLRAVGDRFYARVVLTAPFLNAAILQSDNGIQWTIRAKTGDPLPVGPKLAFIHDFDANASGDLLLKGTVEFSGIPILLLNRGRTLDYVHMLSRPVVDNEYLVRYDSIDLRDDGSVVFSAYDASDRPIIYRLRRN
jgi:hypothetical protein